MHPRQKLFKEEESVTTGDVVLVVEDNLKRGCWKTIKIAKTYLGEDIFVRLFDVKYADGNVFKRPITKLIIMIK